MQGMKKVAAGLAVVGCAMGFPSSARAAAYLSLASGSGAVQCNTALTFDVNNCNSQLFFVNPLTGSITFLGGGINGYYVAGVTLSSTSDPNQSFVADAKTNISNNTAGTAPFIITFAVNNFTNPVGSPLLLSASQSGTFAQGSVGQNEAFTGYGNSANTLTATGVADPTPNCVDLVGGVLTRSCSTTGTPTTFTRAGPFALAGSETVNLTQGGNASFTATVAASTVTPEPGSLVLLGTGLVGMVGLIRRRRIS